MFAPDADLVDTVVLATPEFAAGSRPARRGLRRRGSADSTFDVDHADRLVQAAGRLPASAAAGWGSGGCVAAGGERLYNPFFASIPYEWYTNNDIASYEGFYASVFYSYFAGLGLDVVVEDSSSHGRLDMAVRFNDNIYLFEFKVVELAPEGAAIAQLKAKGYADKYRDRGEPIHLIGVEFSKEARNLAAFDVEQA